MSKQKSLTKISKLNKVRTLRKKLQKKDELGEPILVYDLLVPELQTTF